MACPVAASGSATCSAGSCESSACEDGLTVCGVRCVDTDSDLENCGECGRRCAANGGNPECDDGSCRVQCSSGQTHCDGDCVDLESDEQHCGSCGETCPSEEECRSGSCRGEGLDVDAARELFLDHGVDLDQLARRANVDLDDFEGRHVTLSDLASIGLNRQRLRQLGITDEELEDVGVDVSEGRSP